VTKFPICSALLWHRLMGRRVLSTTFSGTNKIRAYAHCAKQSVSEFSYLYEYQVNDV